MHGKGHWRWRCKVEGRENGRKTRWLDVARENVVQVGSVEGDSWIG